MKHVFIISALVLSLSSWLQPPTIAASQSAEARPLSLTREQWQQDLQYLARELPRRHKNAFHTVSREQFARAVSELDALIPSLQDHEIMVGMMRIVAMVGDAHTALEEPRTFRRYPLTLYWFGNELRVTRTTAAYRRALGARVAQIGELSVADAAMRINSLIPHENDYWVRFLNGTYLPYAEMLHALRVTPELYRAQWTFEDEQGRFSIDMTAVAAGERIQWLSTLREAPLYRQRADEPFWFTAIPDSRAIYANLRGNPDHETFRRVSEELLRSIDSSQAQRLIIDLRLNRGGDFNKMRRFLLPGLRQRAVFRQPGRLFVIIGRATQSAAMVNAIDLRREMGALLVGEPTGGRPNGYSENDEFQLPNSRLQCSYSSRYNRFQDEDTPAVMPGQMIETSWEAYRAGRDPVMEWILARPLNP